MSDYTGDVVKQTTTGTDTIVKVPAPSVTGGMVGWICPVCGRGLSPYTSVCPCHFEGKNGWEVTC